MNQYFIRAAKYALRVTLIFVIVFTLMNLTGYSKVTPDQLSLFFASKDVMIMMVVIAVLIAVHPKLGYVKRSFDLDLVADRDKILNAFAQSGYTIESEDDNAMVLRATGSFNRFMLMNEDAITIDKKTLPFTIEGNRKNLVRIMFRLKP